MKKLRFIAFFTVFIIIISCFANFSVYAGGETGLDYNCNIDFSAKAVYVENLTTGNVVVQKNVDDRLYPASLTKVMTVLLVLENTEPEDLDDEVTAEYDDFNDMDANGSTAGIMVYETLTVNELLHCVMLSSANEACNILARYIGGSISNFVKMMNTRAEELGCENTHFYNTHGLHNEEHYSSAADLVKIIKECLKHEEFTNMCGLSEYTVPATNKSGERKLRTTNYLLVPTQSNYYYSYAKGIKTGFTTPAGACLASYAEKDGITYLSVMLGGVRDADKTNHTMLDTKAVFEWAYSSIAEQDLLDTTTKVAEVPVNLSWDTDFVSVVPEKNIRYLVPSDFDKETLTKDIRLEESVDAPVEKGDVLGVMTVKCGDEVLGKVNLVAQSSVSQSKALYIFSRIEAFVDSIWFKVIIIGIVVLIILYIIIAVIFNRRSKRHSGGRSYSSKRYRKTKSRRYGSRYKY